MKRTLVILVVIGLSLILCNGAFARIPSVPYIVDANTVVLYHFDEPQALGLGYDSTSNVDSYGQKLSLAEADVPDDLIKPEANGAFGGAVSFEGYNVTEWNSGNEAWMRKWTDWPSALTANFSNGLTFEMMLKPNQTQNPTGYSVYLGQFGGTVSLFADYGVNGVNVWTRFNAGFDTYMYSSKSFPYGEWGHFGFTFDKNTGKVANWVNGEDVSNGYFIDSGGSGVSGPGSPDVTGWTLTPSGYNTLCVGSALGYNGITYVGNKLFSGLIDEVRLSNTVRDFNAPPVLPSFITAPYAVDSNTVALFHFDDAQSLGLGYDSTDNVDSYGQKLSMGLADVDPGFITSDADGAFGSAASFKGYNVTSENLGNEAWLRKWTDWPSAFTTTNFSNGFTFELLLKPDARKTPYPNPNANGQVFLGQFGSTLEVWATCAADGVSVWTLFRASGHDTYLYTNQKFPYGMWGHFAFTFSKLTGEVTNWVNGVNATSNYYIDFGPGVAGTGSPDVTGWTLTPVGYSTVCVGNALGYNGITYVGRSLFSGLIDECRISKVVRNFSAPPVLPSLTGTVNLLDFEGDKTTIPVTVNLSGTDYLLNLDIDGKFTILNVPAGTYDVRIKASHWLAKMTSGVEILAGNKLMDSVSLINGDVVDSNEVDFDDINAVRIAYGSFPGDDNWNERADVDGTGEVDFTDINIVRSKYGEIGD